MDGQRKEGHLDGQRKEDHLDGQRKDNDSGEGGVYTHGLGKPGGGGGGLKAKWTPGTRHEIRRPEN